MALRDVLVHIDTDPACGSRADVATILAEAHGAHLIGLHVMLPPTLPGYVEAEVPRGVYEALRNSHDRQRRDRAREAEALFAKHSARGGTIQTEWRVVEGQLVEVAKLHARYADLTVVGQGIDVDERALGHLPEELALAVGRPVLVVPRYGTFRTVGERVLIGWNGGREATRAVHDALPILERARRVIVLSIDPGESPERRLPGADLALHLARHGVKVEATYTTAADISVGDVLLSSAADHSADLIVMGAYGHTRMRELILGGATRHLLAHMTVPVLLSH
jgi:nucleotide-binding universal stress UspA family protein